MRKLVSNIGLLLSRTIGRCIPDPFVLAIALTLLTALLALFLPGTFSDRGETSLPVAILDTSAKVLKINLFVLCVLLEIVIY